jgi:hypothetical protein
MYVIVAAAAIVCFITIASCAGCLILLWKSSLAIRRLYTESLADVARVSNFATNKLKTEGARNDELMRAYQQFVIPGKDRMSKEEMERIVGEPGEVRASDLPKSGMRVKAGI